MLTALSMLLVIAGLVLLAAHPLAGVVVCFIGYALFRRASVRDEEGFVAVLMVLGGLGALAMFGQFLLQCLDGR